MEIKVFGPGCHKCRMLEKVTRKAVEKAGIDASVTKVEDMLEIMNLGILTTPALVVDGHVLLKGKVPGVKEMINLLTT